MLTTTENPLHIRVLVLPGTAYWHIFEALRLASTIGAANSQIDTMWGYHPRLNGGSRELTLILTDSIEEELL